MPELDGNPENDTVGATVAIARFPTCDSGEDAWICVEVRMIIPVDYSMISLKTCLEIALQVASIDDRKLISALQTSRHEEVGLEKSQRLGVSTTTLAAIRRDTECLSPATRRAFVQKMAFIAGMPVSMFLKRVKDAGGVTEGNPTPDPCDTTRARDDIIGSIHGHLHREMDDGVYRNLLKSDDHLRNHLTYWSANLLQEAIKARLEMSRLMDDFPKFHVDLSKSWARPTKCIWKEPLKVSLAGDMAGAVAAVHRLQELGWSRLGFLPYDVEPIVHGMNGAEQARDLERGDINADFAMLGMPSRVLNRVNPYQCLLPFYNRPIYKITRADDPGGGKWLYGAGGFGQFVQTREEWLKARGRSSVESLEPVEKFHPVTASHGLNDGEAVLAIDPVVGRIESELAADSGLPRFASVRTEYSVPVSLFVRTDLHPDSGPTGDAAYLIKLFVHHFLRAYEMSLRDPSGSRRLLMESRIFVERHAQAVNLPAPPISS